MLVQAGERVDGIASTLPLHPFLFALYPVIRLYQQNMYEVELSDVVLPLLVVMAVTGIAFGILAVLLRDPRRAGIVTSAMVVPVMVFGLLREVLEPVLGSDTLVLLAASALLIVGAAIVALRADARIRSITFGLNVLSVLLVIVAIIPVAQGSVGELGRESDEDAALPPMAQGEVATSRDIYHLILDRYGSEAALEAGFDIDNSEFVAWLRDQGFQVLDDARANYTKTLMSLGSTLGMEHLDDVAARMGADSENLDPVTRRVRNSRAGRFLQAQGYEYIHVGSWYGKTRASKVADRSYVPKAEISFATSLYDSTILPALLDGFDPTDDLARKHADAAEFQWAVLDAIADEPGPKYVFAHLLVPHPPYVFLENGRFKPEKATFESQIADTNRRLRAFIKPLLKLPQEERPIIIVQADEGPFPQRYKDGQGGFDWGDATDEEILTKFGILSAMLLPGPEGAAPLPQALTAVNTYPELFRRYFGSDVAHQPDRVMASSRARPWDLVDITDRLAALTSD